MSPWSSILTISPTVDDLSGDAKPVFLVLKADSDFYDDVEWWLFSLWAHLWLLFALIIADIFIKLPGCCWLSLFLLRKQRGEVLFEFHQIFLLLCSYSLIFLIYSPVLSRRVQEDNLEL